VRGGASSTRGKIFRDCGVRGEDRTWTERMIGGGRVLVWMTTRRKKKGFKGREWARVEVNERDGY